MTGIQERRYFFPSEVTAAWLRQGRHCSDCEREIPRDLVEGDHVVAWSDGGRTTLDNLQALCVACNRRKGNRPAPASVIPAPVVTLSTITLRRWQIEALDVVARADEPVLIEACPGSGKTRFALEAAARLLVSGAVNRVMVVVPTSRLVEQWTTEAASGEGSAKIPLAPPTWRPTQPIYEKWGGAVFTYQALFAQTTMFAALASEPGYRTMVVFDEVHHAGADSGWGIRAQQAFTSAARRIVSLSGTAFRTRDPIIFVRTEKGQAVPDYRYSYGDALRDGVCRPLNFVEVGGTATFRLGNDVHDVSFADDLNERGESYRLRTALSAEGGHLGYMLELAGAQLRALRASGDPDAGGLIVCMDCDHADAVASRLAARDGARPVVVCSRLNSPDDPDPNRGIEAFRTGSQPWLVAVRMVSEGVDIRRLRVIVYATNVVAELGFRQIVGRAVRVDNANHPDFGIVVLPADERLDDIVARIQAEAPIHIQAPIVITDRDTVPRIGPGRGDMTFEVLGSSGSLDRVTDSSGRVAPADLVAAAERYVAATGSSIPAFEIALAATSDDLLRQELLRVWESGNS